MTAINNGNTNDSDTVIGRYSEMDGLELTCSSHTLRILARMFMNYQEPIVLNLNVPDNSASPYDGFLTALEIKEEDGLLRIARDKSKLTISGKEQNMRFLANNLISLADQADTNPQSMPHLHIEYFPDHYFLHQNSEPLVVVVVRDNQTYKHAM